MTALLPARERYRQRKEELSHLAKKSLGQNFLVSDHVINKILSAAKNFNCENIIEIGPGLGALTDGLNLFEKNLSLIELDNTLATYWQSTGKNVIEADALNWNWQSINAQNTLLVSNLPYQISSRLVIDRSLDSQQIKGMVLMFQKEVAQRLRAKLGDELYGFLSVVAQSFWHIEFLLEASSHDFSPPPKVASRVLVFKPIEENKIINKLNYLKFVKACFLQPRKLMLSNLQNGLKLEKDLMANKFIDMNIDLKARAGQLSVEQFKILYFKLNLENERIHGEA